MNDQHGNRGVFTCPATLLDQLAHSALAGAENACGLGKIKAFQRCE
jgi:hypothetical protein